MKQSLQYLLFILAAFKYLTAALLVNATAKDHCQPGVSAFSKIEAEDFDYTSGVHASNNPTGMNFVGGIQQGDVMGFHGMNFHEGATGMSIRVALPHYYTNQVHLHLDSIKNPPFVTVDIGYTGAWSDYVTLNLFLPHVPTGVHDLYFTFTSQASPKESGVVDIDWFQFYQKLPQ